MTQNPSYRFGEDIGPSLFVKASTAAPHTVLKAALGEKAIGVTHEGTREAPIPGITPLCAKSGESARVYGEDETCDVIAGAVAITDGSFVRPDADSKAIPAVHGFWYAGRVQKGVAAGERASIQVQTGIYDNSNAILNGTQAATVTVTASDMGSTMTNTGASGATTFALPAALPGYEINARVTAAQQLRIDPNGTETIALPSTGVQGAAGKYLVADAIGETVQLRCNIAGTWDVLGFTGTWSHEA